MIANNLGSNNNDDPETIPINPNRQNASVVRRFTNLFRNNGRQQPETEGETGYVEFGGMSNPNNNPASSEQRTLGTFAGLMKLTPLEEYSLKTQITFRMLRPSIVIDVLRTCVYSASLLIYACLRLY
jgi:hypothetical protein